MRPLLFAVGAACPGGIAGWPLRTDRLRIAVKNGAENILFSMYLLKLVM